MFVVTRGLVVAGMLTYAVIHFFQMISPPDGAPTWLQVMYGLTAVVALAIATVSLLDERPRRHYAAAGAALSVLSAAALVLSVTVGLFGVSEMDLQPSALIVLVAELMVIGAWAALVVARRSSPYAAADDDASEAEPARDTVRT